MDKKPRKQEYETVSRELIAKAKEGSSSAKEHILRIMHHRIRSLAEEMASKHSGMPEVDRSDFAQWGVIGALNAIEKYNERTAAKTGASFETYAHKLIRGEMLHGIRSLKGKGHLPAHAQEKKTLLETTEETLKQKRGRTPRAEELSEATGIPLNKIASIMRRVESFEAIQEERGECVDKSLSHRPHNADAIALRTAIFNLPEKQRTVIIGHYFRQKSLGEIAEEMGFSTNYAAQLRKKGLATLKVMKELREDDRLLGKE
ncbi:sigma-70 family RNA polymerase sigma factor [Candidatus Micrarchaeota archaeon]|nr:sigma-70 family RNA polymerase sigma factor [Candidatus Micrarchaeota archaeon]